MLLQQHQQYLFLHTTVVEEADRGHVFTHSVIRLEVTNSDVKTSQSTFSLQHIPVE